MHRRLRPLAVLGALGAVLAAPAAASAQDGLDLRLKSTPAWPERELVVSLPTKQILTGDQVQVVENGRRVLGAKVTSEASNRKRGVILAIDASLTMRGTPIREAMIAARSFTRRRGENTPVGVVFFSSTPRLALPPTTDARKLRTTLAVGPALTQGTRIYDAAAAGVDALRAAGMTSGAVVVLSDGAEAVDGSRTNPTELAARARRGSVRIFSVGLASRSFDDTALRSMATATGGRYGEAARPEELPALFAAIGNRLSSEYLVSYRSTEPAGRPVQVEASIAGYTTRTDLGYEAPALSLGAAPAGEAAESTGLDGSKLLLLALGGFLVLTLVLYLLLRPKERSVVSRVSDFADLGVTHMPTMADVRASQDEREPTERWKRLEETVELSGIRTSATTLVFGTVLGTAAFAWYLGFAAGQPALMILALIVPFGVRGYVMAKLRKRRREFEDQLPDNLQVLASALRAGYSFSAALASMAEDATEPSRTELRRASTDEQLGVDISDALAAVGERMDSPEVEYVGIVARMQRDIGGNTAEVLDQVIETIRSRQQLRRMVRALTAQGRMGGAIVSGMPVVAVVGMAITSPGYFDPMFESALGVGLFAAAALMLLCGWLLIRKIVDIKA